MSDSNVTGSGIAAVVQRLEILRCQIASAPPPGWGKRGVTVEIAEDGVQIAEKPSASRGGWAGCHIGTDQIAMVAAKRDASHGRHAAILGLLVNGEILHLEVRSAEGLVDALRRSPLGSRVRPWDDLEEAFLDALDEEPDAEEQSKGDDADAVIAGIDARFKQSRRRIMAMSAAVAVFIVLGIVSALTGSLVLAGVAEAALVLAFAYMQIHHSRTRRRIKRYEAQEEVQLDARPD